MDHRIEEILSRIKNDISQKFVIRDLAASVNLSVSRLQHLFKEEVEISIIKFIHDFRLQKACELLETTHLQIKEIRMKVGVTNEAHFRQDFRQKFGKTASNYRKVFQNSRNGSEIAEIDSK